MSVLDLLIKQNATQGNRNAANARYGSMEVRKAMRAKTMEEENRRLKRIVAGQALDIQMLKDVLSKKWYRQRHDGPRSNTW